MDAATLLAVLLDHASPEVADLPRFGRGIGGGGRKIDRAMEYVPLAGPADCRCNVPLPFQRIAGAARVVAHRARMRAVPAPLVRLAATSPYFIRSMAKPATLMAQLFPGCWIKVFVSQPSSPASSACLPCWHHGIISSVSGGTAKVIHFTQPEPDAAAPPPTPEASAGERSVLETSLEWFLAGGANAQVVDAEPAYSYLEVVARARLHLGASAYSLPTRNCEHFASWCYLSSAFSHQVWAFGAGAGVISVLLGVISVVAMSMARKKWV